MGKSTITDKDFNVFLNSLVIEFNDEDGIATVYDSEKYSDFASVNYETETEDVPEEMYLDEDNMFTVTESQRTMFLEYVDAQTLSEKNSYQEHKNEPSCKYELFGVSPADFF